VNVVGYLVWGFAATLLLTLLLAASQTLGVSRMSLPFMIGTIFSPDRDRARLYGFFVHLLNGFVAALIYVAIFEQLGRATWWIGALLGAVHGLFVLTVLLPLMPAVHPRMARSTEGPTVVRLLEPPGALGMSYGPRTPIVVMLAHMLYGAVLGGFYSLG
jgi:hypothetical protein